MAWPTAQLVMLTATLLLCCEASSNPVSTADASRLQPVLGLNMTQLVLDLKVEASELAMSLAFELIAQDQKIHSVELRAHEHEHQVRIMQALCYGPREPFSMLGDSRLAFWEFVEAFADLKDAGYLEVSANSIQFNRTDSYGVTRLVTSRNATATSAGRKVFNCTKLDHLKQRAENPPSDPAMHRVFPLECQPAGDLYCTPPPNSALKQELVAMRHEQVIEDRGSWHQGAMYEDSLIRRLAIMHRNGDLFNKRVGVFGDDDQLGITLALTGLALEIVVFEGDPQLVQRLKKQAAARGLHSPMLTILRYDFRDTFPDEYTRRFDTVVTDPIDGVFGLGTTLSRMAQSMKGPGSAGYFGSAQSEALLRTFATTQSFVLKMGMVFTMVVPDAAVYPGWDDCTDLAMRTFAVLGEVSRSRVCPDSMFYKSRLVRFEALRYPQPLFVGPFSIATEPFLEGRDAGRKHWFDRPHMSRRGFENIIQPADNDHDTGVAVDDDETWDEDEDDSYDEERGWIQVVDAKLYNLRKTDDEEGRN